jgi:metallo-beta-lactamase family protein
MITEPVLGSQLPGRFGPKETAALGRGTERGYHPPHAYSTHRGWHLMTRLTFYGAAGTVTGSCTMVSSSAARFLVDCGLYQGNRSVRDLNFEPFPFDVSGLGFVVLTHAHIDHSGLLPKLVKAGFDGPIYTTGATADLLEFMLPDSAWIQESNAERHNRKRARRNLPPVEPVYTTADAARTLQLLQPVAYERWHEPAAGVHLCFWNAGHILGSASAEVRLDGHKTQSGNTLRILFSGDLGPDEKAFYREPDAPDGFDYVVCESTYGDRDRADYTLAGRRETLRRELSEALGRGGNVVIPSFAVERSQELLHDIGALLATRQIPEATVYLDSPLARKVTEVFMRHAASFADIEVDPERLFRDRHFELVQSVEESKAINRIDSGAIIISASGMCDAGRIKHHLKSNISRPEATVLFVGYQAPGTLGHVLASGSPEVRIHGKHYPVNATIRQIGNYSAHADQAELRDWVVDRGPIVGRLFLNHGDDGARAALRKLLADTGIDRNRIVLPAFDESFELVAGTAESKGRAAARIPDAALQRDWYNDYAAFILRLADTLEATDDRVQRQRLIERLNATLP